MMANAINQCLTTLSWSVKCDSRRYVSNYIKRSQLKYGPAAQIVQEREPWTELLLKEKERQQSRPKNKEPHLLNAIYRTKTLYGRPKKEKDIIKWLGVDEKCNKWQIHKNTPGVNNMIARVKHLLRVIPVSFPHGYPEEECDFENCYLKSNGEFIVKKKVAAAGEKELPQRLEDDEERKKWHLDLPTLRKYNAKILKDYKLNVEHVDNKPVFKNNQDGKEYRYKHNQNPKTKTKHI